jgi:hypothetical protein
MLNAKPTYNLTADTAYLVVAGLEALEEASPGGQRIEELGI